MGFIGVSFDRARMTHLDCCIGDMFRLFVNIRFIKLFESVAVLFLIFFTLCVFPWERKCEDVCVCLSS